ncbi:MAG: hypothetical protein ISR39_14285 [Akkermansiaceae bacterium]|nr:hypothetical protein [Akkermansiaceae bacterium]
MIENIRKYTGLMIVVLVLLFIGLVFLGDTARNSFAGKPVMEVNGVAVSRKEFDRMSGNALQIPSALAQASPLSQSSKVIASHYLGDSVLANPMTSAASILTEMTEYLQGSDPGRFLANRIAVREAGLDYGATPGPDEVESFIERVLFADQDGNFDQVAFSEFMEKKIGRLGIGSRGFNEYVRDLLTAQNIAKILGAGIAVDSSTAATHYSLDKQNITAQQVTLDMLDFEKDLKPTEEEIKAFYEENKENYFSDELRKTTYIFAEPDWQAAYDKQEEEKAKAAEEEKKAADEAKKKAEEAKAKADAEKKTGEETTAPKVNGEAPSTPEKPGETPPSPEKTTETGETTETAESPEKPAEVPAETTEGGAEGDPGAQGEPAPETPAKEETPAPKSEETPAPPAEKTAEPEAAKDAPAKPKVETKPAPAPEKSPRDKLSFQNKEKAVDSLSNDISDFFDDLINDGGNDFEKHAADAGYEVKISELFSQSKPAEGLDQRITSKNTDSGISTLADAIFRAPVDGEPDERLTYPYRTSDGWFVGRLDEAVAPVQLSYEEAKVRATVDLKKKTARDKMIARAKELHEKLSASVKEGKTFEEAAKAIDEKIVVSKQPNLAKPDLSGIPIQYRAQFGGQAPPAFEAAQYVNPREIAEVKFTPSEDNPEKALIVFVEKREVTVSDAYSSELNRSIDNQSSLARYLAFQNWLYEQYDKNQVIVVGDKQQ